MSDKMNTDDGEIDSRRRGKITRAIHAMRIIPGVREEIDEHRRIVDTRAMNALVDGGLDPKAAKLAVMLIARRVIPAISIEY